MKSVWLLLPLLCAQVGLASARQTHNWLIKGDTAEVPKEIEDPQCLGIHKEAAHATLMPYADLKEALKADRYASTFSRSLNGTWKFHYVPWPQQRPVDFYKTDYDVSRWDNIRVPSNWQVEGYGTPYYSNYTYIFKKDFPHVMSAPPVSWTAYKERNPVGSYRRDFDLPLDWKGRRIFLTFDGVDAGFFLWVNGKKVGYSVNSRNAADFDVTAYVKPGKNIIAVEVYRFTVGSYLEDQDMFRLSGIFRNVTLWSAPQEHIRDFFVHTDLDEAYTNAQLRVSAKVKNYDAVAIGARTLHVDLYDKDVLVQKGVSVAVPALQPGEEKVVMAQIAVTNPKKWTAETPYLYTTVLSLRSIDGKTLETLSSRTGFRKIEIKGRVFLVNGVAVKLKGVNRHENWPDDGHAIREAQMIRDIVLIKQANCNHVRTCHYSDDPHWYELCDEYGIYVLAEANLECHGSWDEFNEDPRMKAAIIDRNVANVENFKNHPAVIIWSLGNECGSGGSNFRAALATIRGIDPGRPTHYQGFGIGGDNPSDIDSEMYTDLKDLNEHAQDASLIKPFYLCEYAHAMFNSMGSVDEYNELFDKYPTLLGGCIWEWQDQGIYNNIDPHHHITAYGGGFGEVPNDHYFIHKGVVFSDRSPKPHYPALKHAYQWISIRAASASSGNITIVNKYQFINLDGFQGHWKLMKNGMAADSGVFRVLDLKPQDSTQVQLPALTMSDAGDEYILRVSFTTLTPAIWAPAGYEVAWKQLPLTPYVMKPHVAGGLGGVPLAAGSPAAPASGASQASASDAAPLQIFEDTAAIAIHGASFDFLFSKKSGSITSIKSKGQEILAEGGGPKLHLWRAPHQIDDMWAYRSWEKYGLKDLAWTASQVSFSKTATGGVLIQAFLTGKGKADFVVHQQVAYTIDANGTIHAYNDLAFNVSDIPLARIGVRLLLNKDFNQVQYYGRGPMENYADRKSAQDIALYTSTPMDQMTGYEKPMECGNHEDVRWVSLSSGSSSLSVSSDSTLLQFSALPYKDEDMEKVEYKIDLPTPQLTALCISAHTLGVGSNGCGPRPLDKYIPFSVNQSFSYVLSLQ